MHELAQLNIGAIRAPMDSPVMAEFANNLDRINALAEAIARLERLKTKGPGPEAFTFAQPFPPPA